MRLVAAPIACALGALLVGCRHVAPEPLDPVARASAFETRSLVAPELRATVEDALGHALPAWPPARWDASTLTAAALALDPVLAVRRAEADRANAAITTAAARPNPTLAFVPERVSNPEAMLSPWIAAVQIDWPIETAGKRDRRIEAARASATAAAFGTQAEASALRLRVATAYLNLTAAQRRAEQLRGERDLASRLAQRIAGRVAEGAASGADAAIYRLAARAAEQAYAEALGALVERRLDLATAVGVPARAVEDLPLAEPESDARLAGVSRAEALELALFARADVLAALATYAAAEAALRLELAKQWPDLHVGPGYQFDQGQDKWAVGLSLELPLLDRNDGPIAEAVAARAAAASAFDATQAAAVAAVDRAIAHREAAAAVQERLAALASERRAQRARAERALALGAGDRSAVLAAELELIRAERARDDAGIERLRAQAELQAAMHAEPAPRAFATATGGSGR